MDLGVPKPRRPRAASEQSTRGLSKKVKRGSKQRSNYHVPVWHDMVMVVSAQERPHHYCGARVTWSAHANLHKTSLLHHCINYKDPWPVTHCLRTVVLRPVQNYQACKRGRSHHVVRRLRHNTVPSVQHAHATRALGVATLHKLLRHNTPSAARYRGLGSHQRIRASAKSHPIHGVELLITLKRALITQAPHEMKSQHELM